MVGKLKELQINIFYDHPSTNCVPPWQPLEAGRCLPRGWGWEGGEGEDEGKLARAPGLNFHLSNLGPLAVGERSAEGRGSWQDLLVQFPWRPPCGKGCWPRRPAKRG